MTLAIAVRRTRPVRPRTTPGTRPQSRMMFFPDEGAGDPVLIPYAPRELEVTEDAGEWVTVNRAGLKDALLYNKPKLRAMRFTLVLADRTYHQPGSWVYGAQVQTALGVYNQLKAYARAGTRMRLAYSSTENGTWRVTAMSLATLLRDDITNEITHCTVDMTLMEASDITLGVGPVTGGATATTTPATPSANTTTSSANYYDVQRGDTLFAIAQRKYGDGNLWPRIADANGITDPRTLQVGARLRIP